MDTQFTWVDTHKAIAQRLLDFETKQPELIQILKNEGETIFKDIDENNVEIRLNEIDPFTFFRYIYKFGSAKSLQRLKFVANSLGISQVPEDVIGVPNSNPQRLWMFSWKKTRKNKEIERLWNFYRLAFDGKINNDLFQDILKIKNVGKANLTDVLFYVNPEKYLPLNSQTKPYLESIGIEPEFDTWNDYLKLTEKVKGKCDVPIYELSRLAIDAKKQVIQLNGGASNPLDQLPTDFPLHEFRLIKTLINIVSASSVDLYYDQVQGFIKKSAIEPGALHINLRKENRLYITIGQRYTLLLKKRPEYFSWALLLKIEYEEEATNHKYFDTIDYFSDGEGSSTYCLAYFNVPLNHPDPDFGVLWDHWLVSAIAYHEEVRNTRMTDKYKNSLNVAALKSFYDLPYRQDIISKCKQSLNFTPQQWILEQYKAIIKTSGLDDEAYKWRLLSKSYWNLEIDDIHSLIKGIPFENLVYALAIDVLKKVSKAKPFELKAALRILFDDEKPVSARVAIFKERIDNLFKEIDPDKSSMHDERTIASYLAVYNPEKYPLYKNTFYRKFCSILKRRQASTNQKYEDYINLLNQFISEFIKNDQELLNLYQEKKPTDGFADKNYLLLAQDILFQVLDGQKEEIAIPPIDGSVAPQPLAPVEPLQQNYWWLNANPSIWSISDFEVGDTQIYTTHNEKGNKRRVYKHFQAVAPGDLVIGYESSPSKQVKAIFEVIEGIHNKEAKEVIEIELTEKLHTPIYWNELQNIPLLKHCEVFINNQGSLFKLSEEEFDIIREVIDVNNPVEDYVPHSQYDYKADPDRPFIPQDEFQTIVDLLERKKNIILQGPPGVGKTFIAHKIAYALMGQVNKANIEMIQFHQSFSYEDFIQGIRPSIDGGFRLKNGMFYLFCKKALAHPDQKFVFIIDEINRGNLSKIFGECLMLIEADKRKDQYSMRLTYSEDELDKFYIPGNLFLIGTMNTADRSLAIVDYALRRRFAFINLKPNFGNPFREFAASNGNSGNLVKHIVRSVHHVNEEILRDSNLGSGFLIGHSYFCTFKGKDESIWYNQVIEHEIKPLLEEIWFDSLDKVESIMNEIRLIHNEDTN